MDKEKQASPLSGEKQAHLAFNGCLQCAIEAHGGTGSGTHSTFCEKPTHLRVYLASSWRNPHYDAVLARLREAGFSVYNFKEANASFNWSQIDSGWDRANPELEPPEILRALSSREAALAFKNDKEALYGADVGVVVLPCGRSAHLEAGVLIGQGKPVFFLYRETERPDLMHLLAGIDRLYDNVTDLVSAMLKLGTVTV